MAIAKEEYITQTFESVDDFKIWLTQQASNGYVLRSLVSHADGILAQATNYSPALSQMAISGQACLVAVVARSLS